jgi:hypothetical protein
MRMKFMSVYVELQKYVKAITCLATVTKLKARSDAASHFLFDCRRCSCVPCFHHSNQTTCSQPFVIFRVLQENIVFRAWFHFKALRIFCKAKRTKISEILWHRISRAVKGKYVEIDRNRKALWVLCSSDKRTVAVHALFIRWDTSTKKNEK